MLSLPPGKCFPKPYANPCRFLIHFVGFSFQFEWNEHTKDDELELFWTTKKILDVNLHTQKIEPVFVKYYAPNICLPLNSALFQKKKKNWTSQKS